MENQDILHGYTGKKTECKTRARSPFLINCFWKCMIELKIFDDIEYFGRLPYVNIRYSFVDLIKVYGFSDTKIKYFFYKIIQIIDSVIGIKKEINKIFWSMLGSQQWFRIACGCVLRVVWHRWSGLLWVKTAWSGLKWHEVGRIGLGWAGVD